MLYSAPAHWMTKPFIRNEFRSAAMVKNCARRVRYELTRAPNSTSAWTWIAEMRLREMEVRVPNLGHRRETPSLAFARAKRNAPGFAWKPGALSSAKAGAQARSDTPKFAHRSQQIVLAVTPIKRASANSASLSQQDCDASIVSASKVRQEFDAATVSALNSYLTFAVATVAATKVRREFTADDIDPLNS
jgi:hypothetical protein